MTTPKVLIVEDDLSLQRVIQGLIEQMGLHSSVAGDVPRALEVLASGMHALVIADVNLPGQSGLDLLKTVRSEYPETTVVLMTAFGTIQTAVQAMKIGAYDYVTKPLHPYEFRALINRVMERTSLIEEVQTLRQAVHAEYGFESIIGHSRALQRVLKAAAHVAKTDATVLVLGETGTGKELLARAIHFNSERGSQPFVVVNCGAIPRELLESELFGHVRGSFTGAFTHKKGKAEMADGGTLFLDEIGEMPLDLQVRLLRLVQEREIEKVGAAQQTRVDVRIVAATNRDLNQMVAEGKFREDLFYRIAVVPLTLPPLRERREDIPALVEKFFESSKRRYGRERLKFPEFLMPQFQSHDWPGNVRELENIIARIVVLSSGDEITGVELPAALRPALPVRAGQTLMLPEEGLSLPELERNVIVAALRRFMGNQSGAARYLSITRKVLVTRIAKHRISEAELEDGENRRVQRATGSS